MKLSVIIPTSNRSCCLLLALESICRQTISQDKFEVIVVDNMSKDDTKKVTISFLNRIKNLKYYYEDKPGLYRGRHCGLKEANSEILVYADDDIEAFPTWLEGVEESFEDSRTVLVGGKNIPKYLSKPPEWILRMWGNTEEYDHVLAYLSILDLGEKTKEIDPNYVFGCNFSIRKAILLEAGGFHPDAMPRDLIRYRGDGETYVSKYILDKKYKVMYNPKASVYHVIPGDKLTVKYFCYAAYKAGVSYSFRQIRNSYGLSMDKKENTSKLKNILKNICVAIEKLIYIDKKSVDSEILKKIEASFYAGIKFHQTEVNKDPELLSYVLRKTFLTD